MFREEKTTGRGVVCGIGFQKNGVPMRVAFVARDTLLRAHYYNAYELALGFPKRYFLREIVALHDR